MRDLRASGDVPLPPAYAAFREAVLALREARGPARLPAALVRVLRGGGGASQEDAHEALTRLWRDCFGWTAGTTAPANAVQRAFDVAVGGPAPHRAASVVVRRDDPREGLARAVERHLDGSDLRGDHVLVLLEGRAVDLASLDDAPIFHGRQVMELRSAALRVPGHYWAAVRAADGAWHALDGAGARRAGAFAALRRPGAEARVLVYAARPCLAAAPVGCAGGANGCFAEAAVQLLAHLDVPWP